MSENNVPPSADHLLSQRRAALAVLAQAKASDIARALEPLSGGVEYIELRAPEIGLVMLRGRIGGGGAPFNAGEATVTRAALRLKSGETGFGYVLGRDHDKARLVALCDALWQVEEKRGSVENQVLTPLRQKLDESRTLARAQTAATKVDFFTLVRGEDDR